MKSASLRKDDPIGYMFSLYENSEIDISIHYVKKEDHRLQAFERLHSGFDGISGFSDILKNENLLTEESFPTIRTPIPGSWIQKLQAVRELSKGSSRKNRFWPIEEENKIHHKEQSSQAWSFFSTEETCQIESSSKKNKVSVNTYLLHQFNRSLISLNLGRPNLTLNNWLIPVSQYSKSDFRKTGGNRVSYIEIPIKPEDTAYQLHQKVKILLKKRVDLGPLTALKIGLALGDQFVLKANRKNAFKKKYVGGFTNIGKWKGRGNHSWAMTPPVNHQQPFAIGAIDYNGKLGIGLKAYPSLKLTQIDLKKIAGKFRDLLLIK